ncbi:hypothetical protein L7F22_065253 [Adiantum nelumboides]|nr:hypothetical protein [Adiantum nelumboides]
MREETVVRGTREEHTVNDENTVQSIVPEEQAYCKRDKEAPKKEGSKVKLKEDGREEEHIEGVTRAEEVNRHSTESIMEGSQEGDITMTKKNQHSTLDDSRLDQSYLTEEVAMDGRNAMKDGTQTNGDLENFKAKLAIKELSYRDVEVATDNFAIRIGGGGFGEVSKGTLPDGRLVAVKVASNSNYQGLKEFLNEVDMLSRVHHRSLVELVGYCTDQRLVLVYDFMQNGSLYDCLHAGDVKKPPLPWDRRLKILLDAAQGLEYLHHGCNPPVIHRDIKSSNILLDCNFDAKLSDLGISRNKTGAGTTTLMGSMGYVDPEYLQTSKLTERVDVYSFGVLILEVLSGKKALFVDSLGRQTQLVDWVKPLVERGSVEDLVDERLGEAYSANSAWHMIEVALACIEHVGEKRPTMNVVFLELREASCIEAENETGVLYDIPSMQFSTDSFGGTVSFTNVNTR